MCTYIVYVCGVCTCVGVCEHARVGPMYDACACGICARVHMCVSGF